MRLRAYATSNIEAFRSLEFRHYRMGINDSVQGFFLLLVTLAHDCDFGIRCIAPWFVVVHF